MERKLRRDYLVLPSVCDYAARLSVPDTFGLFMDIATEHAETLGLGAEAMLSRGLFWLTVKTAIRFHRRPALMERVTVSTFPGRPGKARCMRYYTMERDGALLIEGKTEWAVQELQSGKLHSVQDIYPRALELTDEVTCAGAFEKIDEDFSGAETFGTYQIRSTDIDLGGHMNNAAYVRAIVGAFSTERLRALRIAEMEVCFRRPCYEGETLTLRCREAAQGLEIGAIRPEGKAALLVRIKSATDME